MSPCGSTGVVPPESVLYLTLIILFQVLCTAFFIIIVKFYFFIFLFTIFNIIALCLFFPSGSSFPQVQ